MSETKSDSPRAPELDSRLLLLSPRDNVAVVRKALPAGAELTCAGARVVLRAPIPLGHKLAARPIVAGEKVFKYGAPIGSATSDIAVGEHVHVHNLCSDYTPSYVLEEASAAPDEGSDEAQGEGQP